ncbi:MAG TPA: Rrf2 family transcriptional regulator [Candidatus Angelobacter sp.]|nr:Rrf2 family transcriptional regulator [Candidatus Angelobacter sp.]
MIYSRPSEYAIRAFVNLAQVPQGTYAMVKDIAAEEQIPSHFLAKILQQLVHKGLLRSRRGPAGGFALRVAPDEIRLLDIVAALDGLAEYKMCASGVGLCSEAAPCALHRPWKTLRSRILDYLRRNTIAELTQTQKHQMRAKGRRSKRIPGRKI